MHLVVIEAVQHGTARFFQLLGPVDVVLLVEAGAQFHQRDHFLAVFGRFHQRLNDLRFSRHAVEGHLDGNDIGVLRGLFQHCDEGPDGLIRIAEQDVMLLHLGGQVVVLRREHRAGRGIEQLGMPVRFHFGRQLVEEAQVQRALLRKNALVRQFQLFAEDAHDLLRSRGGDLKPDRRQLAAALEQVGHDLAIVDIVVHHPLFHVDVRIAGHPEEALFLHGILAEDQRSVVEHQFFGQCKLGAALAADQL